MNIRITLFGLTILMVVATIGCHNVDDKNIASANRVASESIDSSMGILKPVVECDSLVCVLDTFIQKSKRYVPRNMSFERNLDNLLQCVDIICITEHLSQTELSSFIESVDIIILKQHLFYIKNYHQGYDIYSRHGIKGKHLIEFYLKAINYKVEGDPFLHSGFRYAQYLNSKKPVDNLMLRQLLHEISVEQDRIKRNR